MTLKLVMDRLWKGGACTKPVPLGQATGTAQPVPVGQVDWHRLGFIPKLYLRLLWFFRRTAALFRQNRTFPQLFRIPPLEYLHYTYPLTPQNTSTIYTYSLTPLEYLHSTIYTYPLTPHNTSTIYLYILTPQNTSTIYTYSHECLH